MLPTRTCATPSRPAGSWAARCRGPPPAPRGRRWPEGRVLGARNRSQMVSFRPFGSARRPSGRGQTAVPGWANWRRVQACRHPRAKQREGLAESVPAAAAGRFSHPSTRPPVVSQLNAPLFCRKTSNFTSRKNTKNKTIWGPKNTCGLECKNRTNASHSKRGLQYGRTGGRMRSRKRPAAQNEPTLPVARK